MASRASLSSMPSPSCPPLTHWALPLRATQWLRWLTGGGTPSIASRTCPCLPWMEWRWANTGDAAYCHLGGMFWSVSVRLHMEYAYHLHIPSLLVYGMAKSFSKTLLHLYGQLPFCPTLEQAVPGMWQQHLHMYCRVAIPTVLYCIQYLHNSKLILYAGYGWGPDWEWGGVWWAGPSGIVSTWGLVDELCEAAEVSGENWKEGDITIEVFDSNSLFIVR